MFWYASVFISYIIILLLANLLSCNIKDKKSLQNYNSDKSVKNTEVQIKYKTIPAGTCSNYKIISSLDTKIVNQHLKLIDSENQFFLDKDLQKICAYNVVILSNTESIKKIAHIGASAHFVLEDQIISNIVTVSETPSIVNITQLGLQTFIPLDGNSEPFSIWVQHNINEKFERLNSIEKITVFGNKNENNVLFQIKKVPENDFSLFYLTVPKDFSYGNYDLIFQVNEAANVELLFPIQVVQKDEILGSPEIKSIEVHLLKTPNIPNNSTIQIGECVDYSVIAVDLNGKKHSITNMKHLYTTSFYPEKRGFSVNPTKGKICAFEVDGTNNLFYPSENEMVEFHVKYNKVAKEEITNTISLVAAFTKEKIKFTPKIASIEIRLSNNNSTIPINSCIDYNVILIDSDGNEQDITKQNSYITSFSPEQSGFSMYPKKGKICAFQDDGKPPEQNKTVNFNVKYKVIGTYKEIIDTVSLVTAAEPEFVLQQYNPISTDLNEYNLTAYAGLKTQNFKINLIKTLDRSQTSFASNEEDFEILDEENRSIKLNSLHDPTLFNFIMPEYARGNYNFTLRMKKYPSITADFSVTVR
ncbi:hypothetical protein [Spirobacillus cienkowskii]|uniref:hypothetical protein n=1 Tax=Spirobacillus cienkowskii TaxID=495820 RepID=UPI0030D14661